MGYERFYSPYDYQGRGLFPEYDPVEFNVSRENSVELFLDTTAMTVARRGAQRVDPSFRDGMSMALAIRSLEWVTGAMRDDLTKLVVVKPGDEVASRISSRIIDVPAVGKVTPEWVEDYITARARVLAGEPFTRFPCTPETAEVLYAIGDRTGVDSFQILGIHGASFLDLSSNEVQERGNVIAITNRSLTEAIFLPNDIMPSRLSVDDQLKVMENVKKIGPVILLADPLGVDPQ